MILGMKLDNDKPDTIKQLEHDAKVAAQAAKPKPTVTAVKSEAVPQAAPPAPAIPNVHEAEKVDPTKIVSHKITLTGDGESLDVDADNDA